MSLGISDVKTAIQGYIDGKNLDVRLVINNDSIFLRKYAPENITISDSMIILSENEGKLKTYVSLDSISCMVVIEK